MKEETFGRNPSAIKRSVAARFGELVEITAPTADSQDGGVSVRCAWGHGFTLTPAQLARGRWCLTCESKELATLRVLAGFSPGEHLKGLDVLDEIVRPEYAASRLGAITAVIHRRYGQLLSISSQESKRKGVWATYKMVVKCARGHTFEIDWKNLARGGWCSECAAGEMQAMREAMLQRASNIAKERGGVLLSTTYSDSRSPLVWQCHKLHQWQANLDNVSNKGSWCPRCASSIKQIARWAAYREGRGG